MVVDDDRRRSLRQNPPTLLSSASSIPYSNEFQRSKSSLQLRLEQAIDSPGGIAKILHIIQSKATKDHEIERLNELSWSPLVRGIFFFGSRTTKKGNTSKSEEQLDHLIRVFHQRGISMNSGDYFGSQFHRPLIVAAYYGYHSAVQLLVQFGALPDLRDGEGRNALFAALQNPTGRQWLRECDKQTAQILVDLGVITPDLKVWRQAPPGTLCYVNDRSLRLSSAMCFALRDKNVDVVKFLCNVGAVITEKDYLPIRRRGRVVRDGFLVVVAEVYADSNLQVTASTNTTNDDSRTKSQLIDSVKSWNPHIGWSFPPLWHATVLLCGDCGLPSAIFRTHVVPFLGRDWFYSI